MNSETYNPPAREPEPKSLLAHLANLALVLLVVGFVAAIIFPNRHHHRETAPRAVDASKLRQIGQASLIYASDSQDQLPQVDDIHAFATALAQKSGLNDATTWITTEEGRNSAYAALSTVLTSDRSATAPAFAAIRPSFAAAVRGLHARLPSTTPIAWTRGLQPDGTWAKDSPYGGKGGHVVFLGGNVAFFRKAEFISRDGLPTSDIRAAIPPDAIIANN